MGEVTICIKCGELKKRKDGHISRWTPFVTALRNSKMEECGQCGGSGKEKWTKGRFVRMIECTRCRGEGKIIAPTFLCCCCDAEINHNGACNLHLVETAPK